MARKIPPRRVPRDREQQRAISSGSIFGGSSIPGAHTHLEADITDLGPYLLLTSGTLTNSLTVQGNISAVSADPRFRWQETDAAADNKEWDMIVTGEQLRLRVLSDIFSANNVMTVDRTGNTVATINFLGTALQHNGTDVFLASGGTLTGATTINVAADAASFLHIGEASTARGSAQRGNLRLWGEDGVGTITHATILNTGANLSIAHQTGAVQINSPLDVITGNEFRVRDTGNTDWGEWDHDGADFNLTLTNTTNYNITGMSLIKVAGGLHLQGGALTVIDSGDTDSGVLSHDGTSFKIALTNANNFEISGITNLMTLDGLGIRLLNTAAYKAVDFAGSASLNLISLNVSDEVVIDGSSGGTLINSTVGFQGTSPIAKPTVSGSRSSNAALASLLTALANYGLITDSTS